MYRIDVFINTVKMNVYDRVVKRVKLKCFFINLNIIFAKTLRWIKINH